MKSKTILVMFFLVIFISCLKKNNSAKDEITYLNYKNNLKSNMNYNSIVAKFGKPSKDIGSGIHIYVYQLVDSTEIWIGYADKIIYARHLDANHQIMEKII